MFRQRLDWYAVEAKLTELVNALVARFDGNEEKIKELEARIKELESKPQVINNYYTQKEPVTYPPYDPTYPYTWPQPIWTSTLTFKDVT